MIKKGVFMFFFIFYGKDLLSRFFFILYILIYFVCENKSILFYEFVFLFFIDRLCLEIIK